MKTLFPTIAAFALLAVLPAGAQNLTVTGSAAPVAGGLYHYDYVFTDLGDPYVDALTLTSDDLAPLNLSFLKDGAASVWGQVAGPADSLLFYGNGDFLTNGDTLEVQFDDSAQLFTPTPGHTSVGYDLTPGTPFAGTAFPVQGKVPGPSAAVPEPSALPLLALGLLGLGGLRRRR